MMTTTLFCADQYFDVNAIAHSEGFNYLTISVSGSESGHHDSVTLHSISDEQLIKLRDVIDCFLKDEATQKGDEADVSQFKLHQVDQGSE